MGIVAVLLSLVAALVGTTASWGANLRSDNRLLPGTHIASVDVGNVTIDEARVALSAVLDERLDREITVRDGDRTWTTTARELGATTDLDEVLAAAFARTQDADLATLARLRFGDGPTHGFDITLDVGTDAVGAFVAAVADSVDQEPQDAVLTWETDVFLVEASTIGRKVERDAVLAALIDAVSSGHDEVELPVIETAPDVDTARAEQVAGELTPAINGTLDRTITAALGDRTWTTTPRDLGATADVPALVRTALTGDEIGAIHLDVPDDGLEGFVDRIAGDVYVPAKDAQATWSGGRLRVSGEQTGVALLRDDARAALADAIAGGDDTVAVSTVSTQPAVRKALFDERYLVVDQSARSLYYFRNGKKVKEWPVAVGLAGSPTPTGLFTVGAKRFEPVWNNPSPNGWGSDMPARIGPGPDNPLGVRALNWNRNGSDTLIRFHGTPNEASIGEAASRGCVRMYNSDVIELYDLVPSGTPILSVR